MKFIGVILIMFGLPFYTWHLLGPGNPPDFFRTLAGAVVALLGLWFVLWPAPEGENSSHCEGPQLRRP